jgi:hypothetical protein
MFLRTLVFVSLGLAIAGCSNKDEAAERREAEADVAAQMPSGPQSLPVQDLPMPGDAPGVPADGGPATMATVDPDFDPASVPVTTVSLPPFPFFKDPEGLENDLKGADASLAFDRHYFIAGNIHPSCWPRLPAAATRWKNSAAPPPPPTTAPSITPTWSAPRTRNTGST